jgi:hypothetical protein
MNWRTYRGLEIGKSGSIRPGQYARGFSVTAIRLHDNAIGRPLVLAVVEGGMGGAEAETAPAAISNGPRGRETPDSTRPPSQSISSRRRQHQIPAPKHVGPMPPASGPGLAIPQLDLNGVKSLSRHEPRPVLFQHRPPS